MAGGVAAATPLAGAVATSLGISAGLAATGIGVLAAIPAAIIAGLATPNTVTKTPTGKTGITVNMADDSITGWQGMRRTESGMFGSQSTSHYTQAIPADPALAKAWNDGLAANTKSLETNLRVLGMSTKALDEWEFPQSFDVDQEHLVEYLGRIDHGMGGAAISAEGLTARFESVALEGEAWGDEIRRLGTSLQAAHDITVATGFAFDGLTAGMDTIGKADFVYRLAEAAGGIQEVQTALGLLTKHTMDNSGRLQAAIHDLEAQAAPRLAALGTDFDNFWGAMQAAMSGPISAEDAAAWLGETKIVNQLGTLRDSLAALGKQAEATAEAAHQFDMALDARALSAKGFTYQAQVVSMLASQEAELTQARERGVSAAQMARLAEVQALEKAALEKQDYEAGLKIGYDLDDRIAAVSDPHGTQWMTDALRNKQADYLKIVWDYGYTLADQSNRAYDLEIQHKMALQAEDTRLADEQLQREHDIRVATEANHKWEADSLKLLGDQAAKLKAASDAGRSPAYMANLVQDQIAELADYFKQATHELQSAADSMSRQYQLDLDARLGGVSTEFEKLTYMLQDYQKEGGRTIAAQKEILDLAAQSASQMRDLGNSIKDTMLGLQQTYLPTNDPNAYFQTMWKEFTADYTKGLGGDEKAIAEAQRIVGTVLDAQKNSTGDYGEFLQTYTRAQSMLSQLGDVANTLATKFDTTHDQVATDAIADAQAAVQAAAIAKVQAEATQAIQQAEAAFRASMEGQIAQGLAYSGAGAGAVTDLANPGYEYTGGMTVDAFLHANPTKVSDYIRWFGENYGMTGSGQYDAWSTLQTLQGLGIHPSGTDPLYAAAIAALQHLEDLQGHALGTVAYGPELAMIGEGGVPEAVIPMPDGWSIPVTLSMPLGSSSAAGGGENPALARAIERLVAAILSSNDHSRRADEEKVATLKKLAGWLDQCGASDGVLRVELEKILQVQVVAS